MKTNCTMNSCRIVVHCHRLSGKCESSCLEMKLMVSTWRTWNRSIVCCRIIVNHAMLQSTAQPNAVLNFKISSRLKRNVFNHKRRFKLNGSVHKMFKISNFLHVATVCTLDDFKNNNFNNLLECFFLTIFKLVSLVPIYSHHKEKLGHIRD